MRNFLFAACQPGSEAALKGDIARRHPSLRFAFSRPGFATFGVADDSSPTLRSPFARTWGHSLGKVTGPDVTELARGLWTLAAARLEPDDLDRCRHLHVWQRDGALPGDEGFDATVETVHAVGVELLSQRPGSAKSLPLNTEVPAGESVLDCVLVEPREWWVGWHRATSPETRWPGGVPLLAPAAMISRAYLKLEEALRWSELPIRPGDHCVEIGSAPGGSCAALLERGCIVTGIDPGEMDASVLANPHFTHVRARARDVPREVFRDTRWLMSDANVAPKHTLDTVGDIVAARDVRIEGLVLTLKLTNSTLTAQLPAFHKRIRGWGYEHVRARQLAFNRREVCVVATARSPSTREPPA